MGFVKVRHFETLADYSFRRDAEGRHVYHPNGRQRKGYIAPSEGEYEAVRRDLIRFYRAAVGGAFLLLPLGALMLKSFWWIYALIIPWLIGWFVWLRLRLRRRTSGWLACAEPLTPEEAADLIQRIRRAIRIMALWSLLLLLISLALGAIAPADPVVYMGFGAVAIGGACCLSLRRSIQALKGDRGANGGLSA